MKILKRFSLKQSRNVALFYLLTTLVMTFPLVWEWRTKLPGGSGDVWQNYWNFWWWKHCLLEGLNPMNGSMLFHPIGVDLVMHTHSAFNQVIAMPLNLLFGGAAAYNFAIVVALTLAGFGTYLLVRELTGNADAALLAGVVFAYFPHTMEQTLEHVNLFSVQFIPLSLYYMVRWSRSHNRSDAVALGICFGLNALCSWHLALMHMLVLLPWATVMAWRRRREWRRVSVDFVIAAVVAILLVLPLLVPVVMMVSDDQAFEPKGPRARGIDPSYLMTPVHANPLMGPLSREKNLARSYAAKGFTCFLGFLPVILGAYGIWRSPRRTSVWLVMFFAATVLAMGDHLVWAGERYANVSLPFLGMRHLPILENLGVANRFMIPAGMALAVLVGYGWTSLRKRPPWALPVAAAVILVEFSWFPYPMQRIELSPLLATVAERPGAVLDLPFNERARTVQNLVTQTVHERPIGGGYIATYPPRLLDAFENIPALASVARRRSPETRIDIDALRDLGFRTVIVHKYRADSYKEARLPDVPKEAMLIRQRVERRFGGTPDETIAAWRKHLDESLGGAAHEDELVAIYHL